MPLSSAARTHASACSSSTWLPWVSQLPYEISVTRRPLRPRCRYSIARRYARPDAEPGPGPGWRMRLVARPTTTWVRAAHADAWQALAVTSEDLPGVRLSPTGL